MSSRTFPALFVAFLLLPSLAYAEQTSEPDPDSLAISKIVLYTSGVGYFQHDGTVLNNAEVLLPIRSAEINDLLKSLVVQDFDGGTVPSIHYQSRDPLSKTLSSLSPDLSRHPTLGELLTQLRGEPVQLSTPTPITGSIVGVEKKSEWQNTGATQQRIDAEYLNIFTNGKLRSVPLAQVQDIHILNHTLNKELQQALAVLARSHDHQRKTVVISFRGEGNRRVRLAYLRETPTWKTSYRLVLHDQEAPFLQGWGIVDNTTDHDWNQVQLSLVSGRPISFIMDLHQPLYSPRPLVRQELHASLSPQTHSDRLDSTAEALQDESDTAIRGQAKAQRFAKNQSLSRAEKKALAFAASPPAPGESFDDSEMDLREGVQAQAQGQETGELFAYTIQTPISIPRHGSAMLPILSQAVEGEKLSLYNAQTHASHPLHVFRLNNTTDVSLMQGPITVFDDNAYAGDAQIKDLPPGQDRLISYALDLNTEVHRKPAPHQHDHISVLLRKGVLIATKKAIRATTYTVKNRSRRQKNVLIEHPYAPDWKLVNTKAPSEQTRAVYRFAMTVAPQKSESLTIQEGKPVEERVSLLTSADNTIGLYLQAKQINPEVKAALEHVVKLRLELSQTREALRKLETRTAHIAKDQQRIRENMHRLTQQSQLYSRYVKKLHAQETELETIQNDIDTLLKQETEQTHALEAYVMGLEIG
ncbi:MAG: hypothetical protein MRJ96_11295 [Nitrospirales bacterium]|nr:hypothetical protein [Nitrospira sp.]MDR4502026.1 hypothetical protein [Nitrospirales bacterium]